jgi:hypothetical protein
MDITYLTQLNNNPTISDHGDVKTLNPISLDEIVSLESTYNNGSQFPAALRELLFLAGGDCYILDYGLNDTQLEMQQDTRENLTRFGRTLSISRPFYVFDVYNAGDMCLLVYLDEGKDDPTVYEAIFDIDPLSSRPWVHSLGCTLSQFINKRLVSILSGYNPF